MTELTQKREATDEKTVLNTPIIQSFRYPQATHDGTSDCRVHLVVNGEPRWQEVDQEWRRTTEQVTTGTQCSGPELEMHLCFTVRVKLAATIFWSEKRNLPRVVARTQTVFAHQRVTAQNVSKMGPRLARRTGNLCPRETPDEGKRRKLPDSSPRESAKMPIKSNWRRTQTSGQFLLRTATSEPTKPAFRSHAKCPRNIGAVNDHTASLAIFWTCCDRRGDPPRSSPATSPLTVVTGLLKEDLKEGPTARAP